MKKNHSRRVTFWVLRVYIIAFAFLLGFFPGKKYPKAEKNENREGTDRRR